MLIEGMLKPPWAARMTALRRTKKNLQKVRQVGGHLNFQSSRLELQLRVRLTVRLTVGPTVRLG